MKNLTDQKVLGVIPARYASTRFPGKPLVNIMGKSMVQRVYERSKKCSSLDEVVVATDDERIFEHVRNFGGVAVMTSDKHQSGTDRCAEVSTLHPDYKIIVNIQGDEPFIDPIQIDLVTQCFDQPGVELATLVKKILTDEELHNPNTPKVVIDQLSNAIYFSRAPLPYFRNAADIEWLKHHVYYKHIGIYGYRADVLQQLTQLPVSSLERAESLEQLRWVENGYHIKVAETQLETLAIDTPLDLQRIMDIYHKLD